MDVVMDFKRTDALFKALGIEFDCWEDKYTAMLVIPVEENYVGFMFDKDDESFMRVETGKLKP